VETARVRAFLDGSGEVKRGRKIGETCTDLGVMAFYDMKEAEEAIAGDNDLYMDKVTKKAFAHCGLAKLKLAKSMTIAYVETGFDGVATVYPLRQARRCAGVEVEMDFAEREAVREDEDE
jgi:hypothetical protein